MGLKVLFVVLEACEGLPRGVLREGFVDFG